MGEAIPTTENTLSVLSEYARVERERRFLLHEMPEPLTRASPHVQIWDNYITGTRLRLRKIRTPQTKTWKLKLTQKHTPEPEDFSRTLITNTYLSAYEYEVLSVFEGNEIRKNRYPFEYEGRKYSIDVFLGALWGLILAETEFETDEEMRSFSPPPFAALEVTQDEIFTGAGLVELTFEELRVKLNERRESKAVSQKSE
jgi:CYTH domain-containing protein